MTVRKILPSQSGHADEYLRTDATNPSWQDAFGYLKVTSVKTSLYTAANMEMVRCNTTGGTFTVNLPVLPNDGDIVAVVDIAGTFGTNILTLNAGTSTVEGTSTIDLDINGAAVTVVYSSTNTNWKIVDTGVGQYIPDVTGNSGKFLTNNGTTVSWGAAGDLSSNTGTSVDSEIMLFSGTGGKTAKRATGSGIAKLTSGVLGTAVSGTDYCPATTGSSILKASSGGTAAIVSGTDIKTINSTSLLGSGDIAISSAWEYITTVTASNQATADIENAMNSYDVYVIVANGIIPATNGQNLRFKMKLGGSYLSSGYGFTIENTRGATYSGFTANAATEARINDDGLFSNTSSNTAGFTMYIYKPADTNIKKLIQWTGIRVDTTAEMTKLNGCATNSSTSALTGIQFLFASGNISGTFRLYGIKNS